MDRSKAKYVTVIWPDNRKTNLLVPNAAGKTGKELLKAAKKRLKDLHNLSDLPEVRLA